MDKFPAGLQYEWSAYLFGLGSNDLLKYQVPGYYMSLAIYWIIKKLGEWMRSQQLENLNDGLSEKDAKRLAKKERKAAKRPQIRMR